MLKPTIRALLVEDNIDDAQLLQRRFAWLEPIELEIIHVETLEEAISVCQISNCQISNRQISNCQISNCQSDAVPHSSHPQPFQLVLLDLGLPDSRGLETLRQFRAAVPDVCIVVLTGLDDEDLALQSVTEGAQDYLVKDQATVQRLSHTVRFAIERQQILMQQKHNEERLRQALERERELSVLKSSFIGMVSHEFRNPLTIIQAAIDLLRSRFQDHLDEKSTLLFRRMQTATDHLVYLLNDVMMLSEVQSGVHQCHPIAFDLADFCLELIDTLRQGIGIQHPIRLVTHHPIDRACTDANLVRHIYVNLLSNAIKYSPEGKEIYCEVATEAGWAILRIHDSGIGIPPQEQHRIFESSYRCSNVGKIAGTGLGLAIVKRCVDTLCGQIAISSEVNVGTTVEVKFPLIFAPKHSSPQ
ncbi:MAG: hybrid sensor histidine kinase/response regulator [Elainella sp. Prado103]|jgi:signal transduction histidine kinase|nr:hybrid sensor histidine kinase/response regulator [Elainella sp. Prado103]